ncbi:hypothetical protein FDF11_13285 [Clostridium botulinum]|nr:hypothetical protein [Clostridium botulinum]NFR14786.1 hypothetical protein [Clostridium botulinum]NFR44894.1 hypothetical protein [Clostridium botulinum]NFS51613.1 hypothetical protein [Clostridium botulinum]
MQQGVNQVTLSGVDTFSIFASITSIILGIVAIWLSFLFYKMSDKSARESEKSAHSIEASVKKLEILFDKLYSGTFDMMKDTVTDMRKHVYSGSNEMQNNNEKIEKEINKKTLSEVAATVEEIKSSQKTDTELQKIIMDIIESSKNNANVVKRNIIRDEVRSYLKVKGKTSFGEVNQYLKEKGLLKSNDPSLFNELKIMTEEGLINNIFEDENGEEIIYHNSILYLL